MVPTRDQLYLTGTDDEVGLAMMAELSEKALQEPYPLSGVPLVLDDGAWADWMPPGDHPLHGRFKQIETNWLAVRYAERKKLLEDVHQRQGIDVFVVSHFRDAGWSQTPLWRLTGAGSTHEPGRGSGRLQRLAREARPHRAWHLGRQPPRGTGRTAAS